MEPIVYIKIKIIQLYANISILILYINIYNDASIKIKTDTVYPRKYSNGLYDKDYLYKFTNGILINAYINPAVNASSSIPLIQIYKTTDTEWVIRTILVYTSDINGSIADSNGMNVSIIIYYI